MWWTLSECFFSVGRNTKGWVIVVCLMHFFFGYFAVMLFFSVVVLSLPILYAFSSPLSISCLCLCGCGVQILLILSICWLSLSDFISPSQLSYSSFVLSVQFGLV